MEFSRSLNQEELLDWQPSLSLKIAILDMNNGMRNMGIRNIKRIIEQFAYQVRMNHFSVGFDVRHYHVRDRSEVPDADCDIYISSGGPGSPHDDEGAVWERQFFDLLDRLLEHNAGHEQKKYFFGICHSFQLMAKKFEIAQLTKRDNRNLGVVPIFATAQGKSDDMFDGLQDKFYAFDNRDWQAVDADMQRLASLKATVLAYEGSESEAGQALTGVRYSAEMESVQFHPEAEKNAVLMRFTDPDERSHIIEILGEEKYDELIRSVQNPNKLLRTYKTILPGFLRRAFNGLMYYYELPLLDKPQA